VNQPRVIFAGTPEFALASLRAIVEAGIRPIAVLTQPDRPAGRGRRLTPSPVKKYALAQELDVLQPATLKDPEVLSMLADLEPDVMIVAAYGLLLPQAVLDIPVHGCINVHASLLPRWRGAAPIQAAILAGDAETGVSLMRMEAGLDTGPVYVSAAIPIVATATAGDVHDQLAELGGRLLVEHWPALMDGSLEPIPQDEAAATYAGKIRPANAVLDWTRPASELQRTVRAYNPVPGARFEFGGETIKCWRASLGDETARPAGKVLRADADGIEVACGAGSLRLLELQRPGRKRVSAAEFAAQLDLADRRFE
jgi:methionyl-tRNA formyltransferase